MITASDKFTCAISAVGGVGLVAWFCEPWIVEWINSLPLTAMPVQCFGDILFWLIQIAFAQAAPRFYSEMLKTLERNRALIICRE